MVEESAPAAATEPSKPTEEPKRAEELIAAPAVAEVQPAEGGVVATEGVEEVPKSEEAPEELAAKEEVTADEHPKTEPTGTDAETSTATDFPATNGTPAANKGHNGKRKSTGAADSKKKTPAKGKKKAPEPRLAVKEGEMYMVAMRGYQPWPVIVCDEEMLPESLLSKRPVSARRIDGTYREDFSDGGKNVKDRRYPIMFLGTNEFAWQVNTELLDFNLEDVKADVESGKQGKKNKALWEAYQTAAQGHDLDYFKQLLASHEEALAQDAEQQALKAQEKSDREVKAKEKATKRKSIAAADSEDIEMEDAGEGAPKKAKGSKKRKKSDESDGENEKPAKTPKTKLKLTTKTPKDASAAKTKKDTKSKKKASEEAETVPADEPQMTDEERLQKREKQILYLRHRLQKGFLSRDQAPKDEDMSSMSDYLKSLEEHPDLEAEIIKKTKVHKVLKAIIKLNELPREEDFKFKDRSSALLSKWSGALASENDAAAGTPATVEPVTNGIKHDDEEEAPGLAKDEAPAEKKDDASAVAADAKPTDSEGDVTMADAEKPVEKSVDATKTELATSAGGAASGTNGIETTTATADAPTAS